MKKIISAIMALTMIVTLGACSSDAGVTTSAGTAPVTTASKGPNLSGTMKVVATSEDYKPLFDLL